MRPLTSESPECTISDVDAATHRAQKRAFWEQVIMAVALVPFVFTAAPFSKSGVMGWIVFVNGTLTHGAGALRLRTRMLFAYVDIATNVALVIYVNATTHWQPGTVLVTTIAALVWVANGLWWRTRYVIAHVVGVQWTLCFLLYVYEYHWF